MGIFNDFPPFKYKKGQIVYINDKESAKIVECCHYDLPFLSCSDCTYYGVLLEGGITYLDETTIEELNE